MASKVALRVRPRLSCGGHRRLHHRWL